MLDPKKIQRALVRKGFKEVPEKSISNGHQFYAFFTVDGTKTDITTKLSNGTGNLNKFECSRMAKQLHLKLEQFRKMMACNISQLEYIVILDKKRIKY